jgi:NitT/TauT family transport system permease protein
MRRDSWQALVAIIAAVAALALPLAVEGGAPIFLLKQGTLGIIVGGVVLIAALFSVRAGSSAGDLGTLVAGVFAGAVFVYSQLPRVEALGHTPISLARFLELTVGFWALVVAIWLLAWLLVNRLALVPTRGRTATMAIRVLVPAIFGIAFLFLWEIIVRGMGVPPVLLPPPSAIGGRLAASVPTLWADFRQTFLRAVIAGYAIGSGAGFLVALLVDRVPFLKRGLLPIGNLVSALPIIAIAPIMVMWFGFDWPSKAAVVVIMTFFPMLVNTVAGLDAADHIQRDLMRTYGAGHRQTLFKLRLPAALPFIFNGLKINTTLALIGAIVAEFFGTPIVGMGFRISTEVGRMSIDMVWAEIAVAAVAGSVFYGVMALIERVCTFWHPSFRTRTVN